MRLMLLLATLTLSSSCAGSTTVRDSLCLKWPDDPPVHYYDHDYTIDEAGEKSPRPSALEKDQLLAYWEARCNR